jgi:hypothetical protein
MIFCGGDVIFNSILNTGRLFVSPPAVTKDWVTSYVSARRLLNLKVKTMF